MASSLGQVLDYSAGVPGAAAIKAAGYAGAARYIGLPKNPKNTTSAELDDFRAHGLGMALVFERLNTDWQQGYAGGQSFGRQARDHANAIGFPSNRPIYMAVDQQVTGLAAHDTAMAYLHGAASVLGGMALTGVYGQASVVARARTEGFAYRWQTKAWSGGVVAADIHLLQNIGAVTVGGVECDTNEVYQADWGQDGGAMTISAEDAKTIAVAVGNEIKDNLFNAHDPRTDFLGPDRTTGGALITRTFKQGLDQLMIWVTEGAHAAATASDYAQEAAERPAAEFTDEQVAAITAQVGLALGGQFDVTITRKTAG